MLLIIGIKHWSGILVLLKLNIFTTESHIRHIEIMTVIISDHIMRFCVTYVVCTGNRLPNLEKCAHCTAIGTCHFCNPASLFNIVIDLISRLIMPLLAPNRITKTQNLS